MVIRLFTNLKVSPTNVCPSMTLEGEDYGLKVSVMSKAGGMANPLHFLLDDSIRK
jgi:hypothetical protein